MPHYVKEDRKVKQPASTVSLRGKCVLITLLPCLSENCSAELERCPAPAGTQDMGEPAATQAGQPSPDPSSLAHTGEVQPGRRLQCLGQAARQRALLAGPEKQVLLLQQVSQAPTEETLLFLAGVLMGAQAASDDWVEASAQPWASKYPKSLECSGGSFTPSPLSPISLQTPLHLRKPVK